MKTLHYTDKEKDDFLNRCDFDLLVELHEEMMIPEDISFAEFLERYNEKHLAKFGYKLQMKLEK